MPKKSSKASTSIGKQKQIPLVEVRNLTFTYPDEPEPVLKDLSLSINAGELIVLTGPSGCGKSTLCRHFNGIIPHLSSGEILSGDILVNGINVDNTQVHELSTKVGMVHQNPESQIVCLEVKDELAFGPENIGLSHEEIVGRVNQIIDWVQLHNIAELLTFECSGGQKQRVAIGSSLALLPDLLVLDEPTTDLDPVGAHDVVTTINVLREKLGITFLLVEHDLDELLEIADRLIIMNKGRIVFDAPPLELLNDHFEELVAIGLRIPEHILIAQRLSELTHRKTNFSLRRDDAIKAFSEWAGDITSLIELPARKEVISKNDWDDKSVPAVQLQNVSFSFDQSGKIVKNVNLEIMPGEFVALVGANGSGKTTLARLLIGLLHPQEGKVSAMEMDTRDTPVEEISQHVGYLFQNPDSQLFNTSVESEIAFGMLMKRMDDESIERKVGEMLALLGLEKYRERHPFALSRGERQRLALATVLVTDPDFIILDEPTTGQDRIMLDHLIGLMREWIDRKQATVLMIAHDMHLVCRHAERTIIMSEGQTVVDGPTIEVFQNNFDVLESLSLLPPTVVEMSYPMVGSHFSRALLDQDDFEWLISNKDN